MEMWEKTSTGDESNHSAKAMSRLIEDEKTDPHDLRSKALSMFDNKHRPGGIRHREKQQAQVEDFLYKSVAGLQKIRCLIVTGMPGAGKTLICTRCIKTMTSARHIFLNAVTVKNFKNFVRMLSKQLYPSKKDLPPNWNVEMLIQLLQKKPLPKQHIIMVDEFDSLFNNENSEVLTIFDLFTQPDTRLTLVATSNSMQMIEKVSKEWESHLPNITNIVFKPYTSDQFAEILCERVEEAYEDTGIKIVFQPKCLKYVGSKLYNLKGGDTRKVLEQIKKILKDVLYRERQLNKTYEITLDDAVKICRNLQPISKQYDVMLSLPLQSQLVLIAIYTIYNQDRGILDFNLKELQDEVQWVNKGLGFQNFSVDRLRDIVKALEAYGFITVKEKKNNIRMVLKISRQDIQNAFEEHSILKKFVESQNKQ